MAKRKQLSTNDLPRKSKGRFNFDLDGAPTGKSSLLRFQQFVVTVHKHFHFGLCTYC